MGTIAANEFITKVIALVKNISTTSEQKGNFTARTKLSSLHVRC